MSDLIKSYFPDASEHQLELFSRLPSLYNSWNEKINVISRKDMDHFTERHVLHSIAIAKFIQFKKNACILDLGTGGGFPGIPLAILFPETQFHLVDSIGKKIHVIQEIATELHLTNVRATKSRAEELNESYDFVVSRAVAQFALIMQWVKGKIKKGNLHQIPNGIICLKGGNLDDELAFLHGKAEVHEISKWFHEEFFKEKKLVYLAV